MPRVEQVPEHADGGYWYVVGAREPEGEPGGRQPALSEGVSGWCAWYGAVNGEELCAVRSPDPIEGVDARDVPVSKVLAAAANEGHAPDDAKPRGRVRGR